MPIPEGRLPRETRSSRQPTELVVELHSPARRTALGQYPGHGPTTSNSVSKFISINALPYRHAIETPLHLRWGGGFLSPGCNAIQHDPPQPEHVRSCAAPAVSHLSLLPARALPSVAGPPRCCCARAARLCTSTRFHARRHRATPLRHSPAPRPDRYWQTQTDQRLTTRGEPPPRLLRRPLHHPLLRDWRRFTSLALPVHSTHCSPPYARARYRLRTAERRRSLIS